MTYTIEYASSAARAIRKLNTSTARIILDAVEELATNPHPYGAIKLKGGAGEIRIRVGDYRVIYETHDTHLVVLVLKVAHRREVYR